MNYLKEGRRVRVNGGWSGKNFKNNKGIISEVDKMDNSLPFCIEFDDFIDGHSNSGRGKDGHCCWVEKKMVTPIFTKDDVEVGDMVRVKAPENREGYPTWEKYLDKFDGELINVVSKDSDGTFLGNSKETWWFSYEWVTEVTKKREAVKGMEEKIWAFYVEKDGKKFGFSEFNLVDIYKNKPAYCGEFDKEFIELMKEWGSDPLYRVTSKREFEKTYTLIKNLTWLVEKGFGEEIKKKETPLVPGTILTDEDEEEIVVMSDGRLYLGKGWDIDDEFFMDDKKEIRPKTLEEFQKIGGCSGYRVKG